MECPRCQKANPDGARFWLNCGAQLEAATDEPRPDGRADR
jgi:hypothetical protein